MTHVPITAATVSHLGFDVLAFMKRLHAASNLNGCAMQLVSLSADGHLKRLSDARSHCGRDGSWISDHHNPPLCLLFHQFCENECAVTSRTAADVVAHVDQSDGKFVACHRASYGCSRIW